MIEAGETHKRVAIIFNVGSSTPYKKYPSQDDY
ncbi:hypothetical protein [Kosakonia pseudosacchari]